MRGDLEALWGDAVPVREPLCPGLQAVGEQPADQAVGPGGHDDAVGAGVAVEGGVDAHDVEAALPGLVAQGEIGCRGRMPGGPRAGK